MLNSRERLPERAKYTYSYDIAFSNGMAALKKQKKYNWKETNLAQFGSELEKQVRHVYLKLLKLIFVYLYLSLRRLLLLAILMYLIFTSCVSQIKKASAEGEDAWKEAGTKEGLQVWRIVQFKVLQGTVCS